MSWYVYMLRLSDDSLYTGASTNVERRVRKHSAGKGSKYVRSRLPVIAWITIPVKDQSTALRLEAFIKKLSREDKVAIYESESPERGSVLKGFTW